MSGIGQAPSKRRRLSDKLDDGDEADVISLSVCSRHPDEEQKSNVFVSLVLCWSKTIVLYDAVMLFQVHKILSGTGRGASLCSCDGLPASLLSVRDMRTLCIGK